MKLFSLKKKKPVEEKEKQEELLFKVDTEQLIAQLPDIEDKIRLDVKYPLIKPFAYAHIYYDANLQEVIYNVEEPKLEDDEKEIYKTSEEGIRELINISFVNIKDANVIIEYLEKNVKILLNELGIKVNNDTFLKLMYYLYRNFIGLNEIEPLMRDYFIEDIECNGVNTPIYIVHRKYRNLRTNIIFEDHKKLANFVEKLAQKCGKYVSYASPLLDGRLPDGSRVNAVFTSDISTRGATFTVRKFTREPWTPVKLMDFRTVSPEILAYFWILLEYEANIMIIGGTGSGKTSFLNSIAFFIPPAARIVSIEDTKELNLLHENWLPSVAREGTGLANILGQKHGEVSLFDLLKESFRQRPDYVIVGEIRGKEAFVLFQGASSVKGNERVLVLNDEHPKRIAIKDLRNNIKYKAITIDPNDGKVKILPVKYKKTHDPRKIFYEILTESGREVVVTPDHSVFGYDKDIIPLRVEELKPGDKIVIPAKIPCGYADVDSIDLTQEIDNLRIYAPDLIKKAVKRLGYDNCCKVGDVKAISDYYANFTKHMASALETKKFTKLMKHAKISYSLDDLKVKVKYGNKMKSKLELNRDFLKLMGYYLSEGSLNESAANSNISFYNKDENVIKDINDCIKRFTGKEPKQRKIDRGYGVCTELSFSNKLLCQFIKKNFGKKDNKKIADFIFGLSKEKIGWFLSGLWAGDGEINKYRIGYYTTSRLLANDVAQLLLVYNILCKIRKRIREGRKKSDYELLFYSREEKERFLRYVKPVNKKVNLSELRKIKSKKSKNFIEDIYIDRIKSISRIKLSKEEPVYDISVSSTQNFVGGFGGLMLHNSGHPTLSTMHAESVEAMLRRLETEPINLSPALIEALDVVGIMIETKVAGNTVRRLKEIVEIRKVEKEEGKAITNTPFVRDPATDKFYFKTSSIIFDKIIVQYGISKEKLNREFLIRSKLLYKLYQNKIFGFKEVQEVINVYYKNPEEVLKKFGII